MYQLRLAQFDGSLDLLLALVERAELDVTSLLLVEVVGQYSTYLRSHAPPDPAEVAEFVAIAARLMLLKSRALLPRAPAANDDAERIETDREIIAELLAQYARFKQVAGGFREREVSGLRSFPRPASPLPAPLPPPPLPASVTLDRLVAIVQETLRRSPPPSPASTPRHTVTIREQVELLCRQLAAEGQVSFRDHIGRCRDRLEIVVAFMAVLELIKLGAAIARQQTPFGDILLVPPPAD